MIQFKEVLKFVVALVAIFVIFSIFTKRGQKKRLKSHFNGRIEALRIGDKMTPVVTIHGQQYPIISSRKFNENIEVGDFLSKEENSTEYTLVKAKTGLVIYSKPSNY